MTVVGFGTVTGTAPLTVREDGASRAVAAKVLGGSGYTPALDGRVVLAFIDGRVYILGGA